MIRITSYNVCYTKLLRASVVIIVFISIFFLSNPDQEAEVISSYKVQVEQKNEGLGFAGDEQQDIIIEVIEDGKHSFHYKMNKEKLQIYVEQGRNIGRNNFV